MLMTVRSKLREELNKNNKMLLHKKGVILVLLLSVCFTGATNQDDTPTVRITTGDVVGGIAVSRGGKEYTFFKGIPFGKVEKRFANSKPADKWATPLKAVDKAANCINTGLFGPPSGIEDCLTVDVYTPKLPSTKDSALLPVMVWIYGGGFVEGGTNEYSGSYFMDSPNPVVLIMINYRLGAFGFLNTGVASATGNQGMKDLVLGLKWVQENIAAFSGDKNKVTIFGESAGSISVSLLTLSPMAKGLFHRAIMQSGTAIQPFLTGGLDGRKSANKLARELDCPTSNAEYLVECLQKVDAKLFGKWMGIVNEYGYDGSTSFTRPSIETWGGPENEVFLSEDPYRLAVDGKFARIPIIMGLIGWESFSFANTITKSAKTTHTLNARWGRVMETMLFLSDTAEDPAKVVTAIKDHFLSGKDVNGEDVMVLENLISERHWIHPFRRMATLYAKHAPVYLYNFTHPVQVLKNLDPEWEVFIPKGKDGETRRTPSHADDLPYILEGTGDMAIFWEQIGNDSEDIKLSQNMISTWTSFAKTGKPDGPWGEWPTLGDADEGEAKILHIQDPPKLMPLPKSWRENDAFWNSLSISEYGKKWSNNDDDDKEKCIH